MRFGKLNNIIWTMGGDNDLKSIRAEIVAMAEGLPQGHTPATYYVSCQPAPQQHRSISVRA